LEGNSHEHSLARRRNVRPYSLRADIHHCLPPHNPLRYRGFASFHCSIVTRDITRRSASGGPLQSDAEASLHEAVLSGNWRFFNSYSGVMGVVPVVPTGRLGSLSGRTIPNRLRVGSFLGIRGSPSLYSCLAKPIPIRPQAGRPLGTTSWFLIRRKPVISRALFDGR
jgi:hypothetical protein